MRRRDSGMCAGMERRTLLNTAVEVVDRAKMRSGVTKVRVADYS